MTESGPDRAADLTIAELLEQLTGQTARLVRQEVALVREEMLTKASRAGMGTMLFGGAGALAVYGTGAVVAGVIAALATELPPWAAALIVGGGLLSASGVLALLGRRQLRRVLPLIPKDASARVKADAKAITEGARK
jgi:Putative Actinobacterial Holin-X, holin superfamily III